MSDDFAIMQVDRLGSRAAVLRVSGRLDARAAPQLIAHVSQARPPGGHLVLNLAAVTFFSSSGAGALLVLSEKANEDGGSVRLAQVAPVVKQALELLDLDEYLILDATEEESVAKLEAA